MMKTKKTRPHEDKYPPAWHGWMVRQAFWEGVRWAREQVQGECPHSELQGKSGLCHECGEFVLVRRKMG